MLKKILGSRVFAFWLIMTVIGFFVGYTYSVMDAKKSQVSSTRLLQESGRVYVPPAQTDLEMEREDWEE